MGGSDEAFERAALPVLSKAGWKYEELQPANLAKRYSQIMSCADCQAERFAPLLRGPSRADMDSNSRTHWNRIYQTKAPERVSWYRPHLEVSLALIRRSAVSRASSIVDIGGGESTLVDDLVDDGFTNLTVLDISEVAIAETKKRLGRQANRLRWIAGDITQIELSPRAYEVWHDRAVFHFLTEPEQRAAYIRQVIRSVKPGGHVIVGTFGPEGPMKCSGLDVQRYDADSLHGEFGREFRLVESLKELHRTPFGTTQQFLYCYCRLE